MKKDSIFQDTLEELLLSHNLKMGDLAEKTGIAPSRLYSYKRGEDIPSFENATKIAEVFGCSFDYLFGLTDKNKKENYKTSSTPTKRFQELIAQSGLTRYKISKLTGISEAKLSSWYTGRKIPTLSSLYILAKGLSCSLDYLAGRDKI